MRQHAHPYFDGDICEGCRHAQARGFWLGVLVVIGNAVVLGFVLICLYLAVSLAGLL